MITHKYTNEKSISVTAHELPKTVYVLHYTYQEYQEQSGLGDRQYKHVSDKQFVNRDVYDSKHVGDPVDVRYIVKLDLVRSAIASPTDFVRNTQMFFNIIGAVLMGITGFLFIGKYRDS